LSKSATRAFQQEVVVRIVTDADSQQLGMVDVRNDQDAPRTRERLAIIAAVTQRVEEKAACVTAMNGFALPATGGT
jgi:hypothetical protein